MKTKNKRHMKKSKITNIEIQEDVTKRLTDLMDAGVNPWQKSWKGVRERGLPYNLLTKKAYQGTNLTILMIQEAPCNAWVTYKQAKELGGHVCKPGGIPIIYWNFVKKIDKETGEEKVIPFLKRSHVFNALTHCEGLQHLVEGVKPEDILPSEPETALQDYIDREGIELCHGGGRAYYMPSRDLVQMPHEQAFKTRDHYQAVLAHELVHSTGSENRLNRKGIEGKAAFGDKTYAFEELVAEIGACITCAIIGVEPDWDNSAAYLQSWSRKLKDNPTWTISASGKAGKASSFILGIDGGA
tara:strand:- start:308 stop:1204 length:897 start_codon:yes stop_codon:yes gene_type:complete